MKKKYIFTIIILLTIALAAYAVLSYFNLLPKRVYYAEDFDIDVVRSPFDYNGNGVDDYTDIMLGARADAENHPRYDGTYYGGGYPPDNIGVCTDVVWRAFKNTFQAPISIISSVCGEKPVVSKSNTT